MEGRGQGGARSRLEWGVRANSTRGQRGSAEVQGDWGWGHYDPRCASAAPRPSSPSSQGSLCRLTCPSVAWQDGAGRRGAGWAFRAAAWRGCMAVAGLRRLRRLRNERGVAGVAAPHSREARGRDSATARQRRTQGHLRVAKALQSRPCQHPHEPWCHIALPRPPRRGERRAVCLRICPPARARPLCSPLHVYLGVAAVRVGASAPAGPGRPRPSPTATMTASRCSAGALVGVAPRPRPRPRPQPRPAQLQDVGAPAKPVPSDSAAGLYPGLASPMAVVWYGTHGSHWH